MTAANHTRCFSSQANGDSGANELQLPWYTPRVFYEVGGMELNEEQRAAVEQKRQAAIKKLQFRAEQTARAERLKRKADTHGGFFFEEEEGEDDRKKERNSPQMEPPPDLLAGVDKVCQDCGEEFYESLILKQFGVMICDNCRKKNEDGKYSLATKTEARQEYLLTEADLDANLGGLRCIERKNPQNERWGRMKLYLRFQVEKISFDRYGGEEGLDKEIARRGQEKINQKDKKQKKAIAQMRKEMFTSLWRKPVETHEHEFGPEEEIAPGQWAKSCTQCDFSVEFEKM